MARRGLFVFVFVFFVFLMLLVLGFMVGFQLIICKLTVITCHFGKVLGRCTLTLCRVLSFCDHAIRICVYFGKLLLERHFLMLSRHCR